MKKINLFTILILTQFAALAQSDYLITLKSDTIRGDLRILSYDQLDRVQVSNNGKKEMFTALDILTLNKSNEFYKSVQIEKSIRLMKIIKSGYLSLYGYRIDNQITYDGRYLVKLNGDAMEMPNLGFKKIMASFLEDCSELSEKLKKGDLGKGNTDEIIDQYNVCLTKEKPGITVVPESVSTPESLAAANQKQAIQNLMNKIKELNFTTKEDALDILRDIETKVKRNDTVSNYLIEGLRSTLKDQPTVNEDLDKLVALFKK